MTGGFGNENTGQECQAPFQEPALAGATYAGVGGRECLVFAPGCRLGGSAPPTD